MGVGRSAPWAGSSCTRDGGARVLGTSRPQQSPLGGLARRGVASPWFAQALESGGALMTILFWDIESQARNAQLWVRAAPSCSVCPLGLDLPALVSVISCLSLCLWVSGGFPFLPYSAPQRGSPRGSLPTAFCLSLTHTSLSLSSLQTQLWISAATAAGKTCPCPPILPPPIPCSVTNQTPLVPSKPSCHVRSRRCQGP
jgi:hypothetical protein